MDEAGRAKIKDSMLHEMGGKEVTRDVVDSEGNLIMAAGDHLSEERLAAVMACDAKEIRVRNNNIRGIEVEAIKEGDGIIESLAERIVGRVLAENIDDPETGDRIASINDAVDEVLAKRIEKVRDRVSIRSVLTCKSQFGVCIKCYGRDLANHAEVEIGEAVGIIAAQSIGEPGTQLTMRTFHTGGVAGTDITQGLPRVEELFEARKPKGLAIITEFGGIATIKDTKKKREVIVTNNETGETKAYLIPYGSRIKVVDGQELEAGDELTEGSVNPHDILKIKGVRAVQDYMLREVQRVYRLQGVEINDKHVEVIVRQCLQKIRVEEPGDSDLLPGSMVDALDFLELNEKLEEEGKELAVGSQVLLGITKASLATNSFLSAASFQETTKVLTEAAIKGKVDPLIGMKENVIIGKLIPAGTGMKIYRNIKLDSDVNDDDTLDFDDDDFADFAEEEAVGVIDTDAESVDEE